MKLSRYANIVRMDNNDYLLYNSLVMEMFILSFAELNRLITLTLSESEKMIYLKAGILVVDEEVDIKVKEDIKKNYFKKRNKIWNGNPFLDKKVMGVVNNLIRR